MAKPNVASNTYASTNFGKSTSMIPKNDQNMGSKIGQNEGDAQKQDIDVYVRKWVDYSTKYGLGYILSNGNCGVFFNDCTKIIYNP